VAPIVCATNYVKATNALCTTGVARVGNLYIPNTNCTYTGDNAIKIFNPHGGYETTWVDSGNTGQAHLEWRAKTSAGSEFTWMRRDHTGVPRFCCGVYACSFLCSPTICGTSIVRAPIVCATTAFRGTHCGNGAGLTSLNASNLSSGTVAAARLPAAALDYVSGSSFSTNGPDSVLEYAQAYGVTDTKIAPTCDWYNSIRMGHGDPYSYYSNTIAVRMTGTDPGTLYTQTISNNTAGGWKKHWNDSNDGAGSGLDADLLDGQQGSYYYAASNPSGYLWSWCIWCL